MWQVQAIAGNPGLARACADDRVENPIFANPDMFALGYFALAVD